MDRKDVYKLVDGERDYQDATWSSSTALSTTGEITLLRSYLQDFEKHYREEDDAPECDVPAKCLHDVRKMTGILVRAMENNNTPAR